MCSYNYTAQIRSWVMSHFLYNMKVYLPGDVPLHRTDQEHMNFPDKMNMYKSSGMYNFRICVGNVLESQILNFLYLNCTT